MVQFLALERPSLATGWIFSGRSTSVLEEPSATDEFSFAEIRLRYWNGGVRQLGGFSLSEVYNFSTGTAVSRN